MARRKRIAELAAEIAATTDDPTLKKHKAASTATDSPSKLESEPETPYYPEHIIGRKGKGKLLKYKVKW